MTTPLTHYKYLSSQALCLPTELLQVGFFRNDKIQNKETIKHNLSKQQYQLNELFCDTFVETPLFSMMLVEHQNFYFDSSNSDNGDCIALSFERGSKLLKQLKLKGNYMISELKGKLNEFIDKFKDNDFCVNGESITIFEDLFINHNKNTFCYELHEDFIAYLNERKHSLTLVQNSDFVAVKGKTQVAIFLIIQSLKGIDDPFFTKRYIADILGMNGYINKKLSVALGDLKAKHAIEYEKEVCHLPGVSGPFSRFNIKNVDTDFVAKMQEDKSKQTNSNASVPAQSEANKNKEPKAQQTQRVANSPIYDADIHRNSNVISFSTFKAKKIAQGKLNAEELMDLDLDEIDETWVLAVMGGNYIPYRTESGGLGVCLKSQPPKNALVFTPEIMSNVKIKKFIFKEKI